jgi:hypothetical protein
MAHVAHVSDSLDLDSLSVGLSKIEMAHVSDSLDLDSLSVGLSKIEMSMGNFPSGYSIPYPSLSCLIYPHTYPHTHHGCKTHPIPIPIRVSGPQWVPIPN